MPVSRIMHQCIHQMVLIVTRCIIPPWGHGSFWAVRSCIWNLSTLGTVPGAWCLSPSPCGVGHLHWRIILKYKKASSQGFFYTSFLKFLTNLKQQLPYADCPSWPATPTNRHRPSSNYSQFTNCCSSWELMLTRWALSSWQRCSASDQVSLSVKWR